MIKQALGTLKTKPEPPSGHGLGAQRLRMSLFVGGLDRRVAVGDLRVTMNVLPCSSARTEIQPLDAGSI